MYFPAKQVASKSKFRIFVRLRKYNQLAARYEAFFFDIALDDVTCFLHKS